MTELQTVAVYLVALPAGVGALTAAGVVLGRRARRRWREYRRELRNAGVQLPEDTQWLQFNRRRWLR